MKSRALKVKTVGIIITLMLSCSPKIAHSGFLDDYSNLKEAKANKTMLTYVSSSFERGKYKKIMLDSISVLFGEKAKGLKIDEEKLNELTDYFHAEILKNLEPEYEIVKEPGADVVQFQIAITEIVPGKLFSNIFPISVAVNTATGRGKGGASLEMKVIDSQTKELLGQATDNRKNRGYIKSFSKYGNARGVISYWAKLLKERIDLFKTGQ